MIGRSYNLVCTAYCSKVLKNLSEAFPSSLDFPSIYTRLTIFWFYTLQLIISATICSGESLNRVQFADLCLFFVLNKLNKI